jgi:hypothetical protein
VSLLLYEPWSTPNTLARIAGHSLITITQRYVHPQADAIDRAFQQTTTAALIVLPYFPRPETKKNPRWTGHNGKGPILDVRTKIERRRARAQKHCRLCHRGLPGQKTPTTTGPMKTGYQSSKAADACSVAEVRGRVTAKRLSRDP